jgi:predicted flap endonuclease-1-like 5' DNA nuclease
MVAFTTNEWVILALVLVLGWLLGLLSRSGGAKWREAYHEEETRRQAAEARATDAEARLTELERHTTPPVAAPRKRRNTSAEAAPVATEQRGDGRDDLSLIHGIGASGEARLNELGILSYRQLTNLSARDEADLEDRLGAPPGTIEREEWRQQAQLLSRGEHQLHSDRYTV